MLNSTRLAKVVLPGSFLIMSGTVFAASNKESDRSLLTDELSLYTSPQCSVHKVNSEAGPVQQGISSVRKLIGHYTAWCQKKSAFARQKTEEYYMIMEPGIDTSKQFIKNTYEYLNNPTSDFYPSVGVVGFSAILGLYFARTGKVKRFLYPSALMTLSGSMFYPQHVASITKEVKQQLLSWGSYGRVILEELRKKK